MSDIIKLLPDHVASQIAAGEVIQRPASVVKELLENAVDAESTVIKLTIRDGGKTFIQVTDNGKGMSATDARMCWERHATSKINTVEDIFRIRTMGFRGEALASVASVSMVEMMTKKTADQVGSHIKIHGSEVISQEAKATVNGTTIQVKNLFYNIPARRNFLKSDAVETRHIMDEFIRVALAHPEIAMEMIQNENETYILKSGDLALRIKELFSYDLGNQIISVSEETTIANVYGFIGKPEHAKKTRGEQFFFVNQRFIKDPYLNHAIVNCYEALLQKDQFPFYVLFIDIDPAQIDINVHPTKTEIKFEDERAVYQIIRATGKRALGEHYHVSSFEPAGEDMYMNLGNATQTNRGLKDVQTEQNKSNYSGGSLFAKPDSKDWQELFRVVNHPETIGDIPRGDNYKTNQSVLPNTLQIQEHTNKQNLMQVHQRFVLVQVKAGLMLVSQQAAHERILYEKFLSASTQSPIATQQKLFPKNIQVNASDEKIMEELLPEFRAFGMDIQAFGKQTFVLSGMPVEMEHLSEQELIQSLIEQYKAQSYASFNPHERISRILAEKLSINAGTSMTHEEMGELIDALFACKEPNYAPNGNRCIRMISMDELVKLMEK